MKVSSPRVINERVADARKLTQPGRISELKLLQSRLRVSAKPKGVDCVPR